jgi:uncharacterized heparinase superfamily protein
MKRLENMFEFIHSYVRPDGSIPLFGDADDGRLFRFMSEVDINDHRHALSIGAILFNRGDFKISAGRFYQDALWLFGGEGFERYQMIKTAPKNPESRAFPDGGFYIMRGKNVHVMVDAGDIGMGGMGGHGHNDTLSFEYWVNGEPLIVDSGTYAYTFDVAARQELRGTKSHNTIVVDGKEIATFVGLWMIMNDSTKPKVLEWSISDQQDVFEAEHHAYDTVPSPVIHKRRIVLDKVIGTMQVLDVLNGTGTHMLESYLHFFPGIKLQIIDPQRVVATGRNGRYSIKADSGNFSVEETWFSRSYGVRERNATLKLSTMGKVPTRIRMEIGPEAIDAY